MKIVILAGGFGTRLSEETGTRPKPMVQIGTKPILWHIMKLYSFYGHNDFLILLGYKGQYIKDFFANYFLSQSDVTIDMTNGNTEILNNTSEPWKITLIDTGLNSMTGERIKRAEEYIGNERFMLTYGDGVSDINIKKLEDFHIAHGKTITMTSVQPEGRFGALSIDEGDRVSNFLEKPKGDLGWINAGFFVCEPKVFTYIDKNSNEVFEEMPLSKLANDGELYTFKHSGFWKPMDSLKDKNDLNDLWQSRSAPWKIWD
ncbi:MAG: glucose-1-phosphate cytidylyltransferase [Flavobacteriales bacterium]|nr:glucose-1-phosphate cytidylyltransferase [Flavobacteriales bacterium]